MAIAALSSNVTLLMTHGVKGQHVSAGLSCLLFFLAAGVVVHSVIHCDDFPAISRAVMSVFIMQAGRGQHQHLLLCFRFSTTLLGSRAVVGSLVQPSNLLLQQGQEGLSVEQALRQSGFDPSVEAVQAIAMKPEQV